MRQKRLLAVALIVLAAGTTAAPASVRTLPPLRAGAFLQSSVFLVTDFFTPTYRYEMGAYADPLSPGRVRVLAVRHNLGLINIPVDVQDDVHLDSTALIAKEGVVRFRASLDNTGTWDLQGAEGGLALTSDGCPNSTFVGGRIYDKNHGVFDGTVAGERITQVSSCVFFGEGSSGVFAFAPGV